jgi:ribosomal protein L31E
MFNHNTHYEKLCCEGTDLQFFRKHFCYKFKTNDCVGLCSADVTDRVWHIKVKKVDNKLHLKITKNDTTTYDLIVVEIEYVPTADHDKRALLTLIKAH